MKSYLFIFLFFSNFAYGQETIDCFNTSCSPSFTPKSILEKPLYTAIDLGLNTNDVIVQTPVGQDPRSIRLHLENKDTPKDLEINLSSTKAGVNSGEVYVIGDLIKNLNVLTNGFSGEKGQDASEICGEKASTGVYGLDIQTFYNNRRVSDPGVPSLQCDQVDINYMKNFGFSCPDSTYTFTPGTTPVIAVERIVTKSRCSGVLIKQACVKPRATVRCKVCFQETGTSSRRTSCENSTRYTYGYDQDYNLALQRLNDLGLSPGTISGNSNTNSSGIKDFCEDFTQGERFSGPPGYGFRIAGGATVSPRNWRSNDTSGSSKHYSDVDEVLITPNSPGLDLTTITPLPGSNWQVYRTDAYESCANLWTSYRSEITSEITYDENDTACDDVSIPEDPNGLIDWTYTGEVQEPTFGNEIIQCAPGACPVSNTITEFDHQLDDIVPGDGEDASQQGSGKIFVYDIESYSGQSNIGQQGAPGLNDLSRSSSIRYCFRKTDASGANPDLDFAKNPSVNFRKYNWNPIRSSGLGEGGNPPAETDKKIEVFKKVGPSVRHLLKEEVL